jgi:glycosyltransferase involved in cell wall biosynthesis
METHEERKVSVVICAYTNKRLKDIHRAVESVLTQTVKAHEVVIAVDHNEELFHTLREELPPTVKVVLSKGAPGLSETRNTGIRATTAEIIAFIDDDAIAEKNWVENILPHFEQPKVVAVGGQAVPLWPKGKPPFWFPEEFDFIIGCTAHKKLILQSDGEVRNVTGSNMAFKKEIFEKVGFWETKLGRCELGRARFNPTGGEEAEICLRIKTNLPDSAIIFAPGSIVHHKVISERATLRYVFNFCFREGITRVMLDKLASQYQSKPLAAENLFLRRLLFKSFPKRLKHFYNLSNLAQVIVMTTNLSLMGTGYFVGKWRYRRGCE